MYDGPLRHNTLYIGSMPFSLARNIQRSSDGRAIVRLGSGFYSPTNIRLVADPLRLKGYTCLYTYCELHCK